MQFRPLHPDFGAEVIGFDVQNGGTPEEIAALAGAYERYTMLLFRGGGRVSHARHVEIASWFGPPGPVDNSGKGDFVSVLRNEEPAGSLQLPFHSDLTYTDCPIKAICLQAIAVPESGTSTTFVSSMAAWGRLPAPLRADLAGKTLRHLHLANATYGWPDFIAEHPVCKPHPRTGRPILLVTRHHADRILELDEAGSKAMLERLYAYLYAPEARYEHRWQRDDLLIWDNLALQHARTRRSDPSEGKRALQRVALAEVGLPELIERARQRQQAA
ncbi:MAG: TauD/TfdA family dioxygenase [Novosphingobium sp.]|jgi:alpha-ketoglutarate-dependent taurine dioxygenase|nr:TauD/TfdA family dioxygenase [Novosphingobium sp.]